MVNHEEFFYELSFSKLFYLKSNLILIDKTN